MPSLDYSRFDKIEDSDEEEVLRPTETELLAAAKADAARKSFAPAPRADESAPRGGSGREKLEPTNERLRILGGPAPADLGSAARELERWAAPSRADGARREPEEPPRQRPGEPQRLCATVDGRKKIHTTYPDGAELVEEFDEKTNVLLLRKSRKPTALGGEGEWKTEVGQEQDRPFDPTADLLRVSNANPIFVRKDTADDFQWRIRNLPYPPEVYSVSVDHEKQQVVVRTSNKKYYKRIDVPDLARLGLRLDDDQLSWKHQHNTLVVSYRRPAECKTEDEAKLRLADNTALKL